MSKKRPHKKGARVLKPNTEQPLPTCEFHYLPSDGEKYNFIFLKNGYNISKLFFDELKIIPNLRVLKKKVSHQSLAPLEKWTDITTSLGSFAVEEDIDEGYVTISSDNQTLIHLLVAQLHNSPYFYERRKTEEHNIDTEQYGVGTGESEGEHLTRKVPCKYTYESYEYGTVIRISIDEPFNENELFQEIEHIPDLVITDRKMIESFAPVEYHNLISTSLGKFDFHVIKKGQDSGFFVRSTDKSLMELIISQLRKSPHFLEQDITEVARLTMDAEPSEATIVVKPPTADVTPISSSQATLVTSIKRKEGETGGSIILLLFFLFLTLLIVSSTVRFYDDMSVDLQEAKSFEGIVTKRTTDIAYGKHFSKNLAFNLRLEGLPKEFRFFNRTNNFDELLKDIQIGDRIKIYYSRYGSDLYQIEKNGNVIFDKSIYEGKKLPGFIMGIIFTLLSGLGLIIITKIAFRK